jgi:hypothetical protein
VLGALMRKLKGTSWCWNARVGCEQRTKGDGSSLGMNQPKRDDREYHKVDRFH